MVRFHSCIPIPLECDDTINHVAFDGCDYFCTMRCKCEIIRWSPCDSALHTYCTCREYDCICYDYCDHCFWASSRTCCCKIFKLDCCMKEIDCISICASGQYGVITGISYNCCKDALMVSLACAVVEVKKDCEVSSVFYTAKNGLILDVLSICPDLLITVLRDRKYYLEAINPCGKRTACFCINSPYIPKNLLFNPCMSTCERSEIWAFAWKRCCYPYLCQCDISLDRLGFTPCCCNYKICRECCCGRSSCDPCNDIMESIALMETSLSHILNAEGEKLQKVIASTDDIDKILCVNREVNKTIVNATHLEHTLYAKLSALSDCGLCDELCFEKPCGDEL